jgi:hypothetical protein
MLAKSQPSMVSTARSTTACRVSTALPAANRARAVSEKLAVSSEVRSSVVPERSALTMASSIVKWMFRRELYRALS